MSRLELLRSVRRELRSVPPACSLRPPPLEGFVQRFITDRFDRWSDRDAALVAKIRAAEKVMMHAYDEERATAYVAAAKAQHSLALVVANALPANSDDATCAGRIPC